MTVWGLERQSSDPLSCVLARTLLEMGISQPIQGKPEGKRPQAKAEESARDGAQKSKC